MCGHSTIGDMTWRAGVFAAANAPFMLQNVGGTITRWACLAGLSVQRTTLTFACAGRW